MSSTESSPETTPPPLPPPEPAVAAEEAKPPEPIASEAKPPDPPPPRTQPVPEVPAPPLPHDLSRIAQDFQIRKAQVETIVQLLDAGNSVPFITRYRKAATGGLNEDIIRRIQMRLKSLRGLADRKQTILRTIANQGRLHPALTEAILAAEHPKRLEDLYLPYKPKKKSLGAEAREKGLEAFALALWSRDAAVANLDEVLPGMVDPWKQLHEPTDVLAGAKNILAELISDHADVRGPLRAFLWDTAVLRSTKVETLQEGKGKEFHEYFDFREPLRTIPPHRVLAVNRGEREQAIRVFLESDTAIAVEVAAANLPVADHPHKDHLLLVVKDAVERLILPSLEREIRRDLTERAQDHAVHIFARNLRGLLMQPPLRGQRVLAIDPGLRNGCKLAVLDESGTLLDSAIVFPHQPKKELETSKKQIEQFIRKHQTMVIAIGNGTASRETEHLISDLIAEFANRRLSPTTTVSHEPAVLAETPSLTVPEPPALPSVDVPPPVVEPLTTTIEMSSPLGMATTSLSAVNMALPGETSVASAEVTAPAESIAAPVTAAAPADAAPPAPVIDLTGLPDPPENLAYVIVNEAGASDYSTSPAAKEEFPHLDPAIRATISIGRRLQDPLAELVKIDPQHVGVGLYQHDLKPKHLRETLEAVIESCVNHIGVDLNTASASLLRYVSGLNPLTARELVQQRTTSGLFKSLDQLKAIPQVGEARHIQAAGFLKLNGDEPLDHTWIHPEQYELARTVLADLGFGPKELADPARVEALRAKLNAADLESLAKKFSIHPGELDDLFAALARPGRDPRDEMPPPIFKTGMLKLENVKPGMELKGTVLNVVPFGAFVDIGVKESGLVHISQLANRYIKSPYDVVSVGDVVHVWVIEVKADEKKISLTMIPPQRERPREEPREQRPPRGERPREERSDGPRPPRSRRFDPRPQELRGDGLPPRPTRPKPIPKLTEEKKAGKAALNTFGELFAFFKGRDDSAKPPESQSKPSAEPPPPTAEPQS